MLTLASSARVRGPPFTRMGGKGRPRCRNSVRCEEETEVAVNATVQQVPGIKQMDLQEHDLGVPGRIVIRNRVEISPDAPAFRHKHPGEEIIYVLEGTLEYAVDGREPKTYGAGDALLVPAETPHSVRNVGSGNAAELRHVRGPEGKPFLVLVD